MKRTEEARPQVLQRSRQITDVADVLEPDDAEPPILAPAVRQAARQWLLELSPQVAEELTAVNVKPRRSALLSGPPGTGKTTLAHHLAARLGLPLVLVDTARIVDCWLGSTGRNISGLFMALQDQADRCVLLLDEFDALAKKRVSDSKGADNERNNIVIALLQHIDRYPGVFLAATNRAEDIDPAIWRRFGMQIKVDVPDDDARFAILVRYLAPLTLAEPDLNVICDLTAGASPAVLRQLMEGIKRDLVVSKRMGIATDARSVFERLLASIRPHEDLATPPLWESWALAQIDKLDWPPAWPEQKAA